MTSLVVDGNTHAEHSFHIVHCKFEALAGLGLVGLPYLFSFVNDLAVIDVEGNYDEITFFEFE